MTNGSPSSTIDLLGEVVGGSRRSIAVDPVVVEDAERVAQAQVDARRLHHRGVPRVDADAPSSTRRRIVPSERTEVGGHAPKSATRATRSRAALSGRRARRPRATTVRTRGGGGGGAASPCGPRRGRRGRRWRGCAGAAAAAVAAGGVLGPPRASGGSPTTRCTAARRSGSSGHHQVDERPRPRHARCYPRAGRAPSQRARVGRVAA